MAYSSFIYASTMQNVICVFYALKFWFSVVSQRNVVLDCSCACCLVFLICSLNYNELPGLEVVYI